MLNASHVPRGSTWDLTLQSRASDWPFLRLCWLRGGAEKRIPHPGRLSIPRGPWALTPAWRGTVQVVACRAGGSHLRTRTTLCPGLGGWIVPIFVLYACGAFCALCRGLACPSPPPHHSLRLQEPWGQCFPNLPFWCLGQLVLILLLQTCDRVALLPLKPDMPVVMCTCGWGP